MTTATIFDFFSLANLLELLQVRPDRSTTTFCELETCIESLRRSVVSYNNGCVLFQI